MGITLRTTARNAAANAVTELVNGGSIQLQTADSVEVATVNLGSLAFGAPLNGVCTINATVRDEDVNGGTPTKFVARNSANEVEFEGTVGVLGSNADMIISSAVLTAGEKFEIESFTYTQPAGE